MILNPKSIKQFVLPVLLLLTALGAGAIETDISKPVPKLSPTLQQAIASVHVVQLLSRSHYQKIIVNDASASKAFDLYLERLDPTKSYFLQSDISEFEPYREELAESLKSGDLKPAFAMYNRSRHRLEKRSRFMLAQLEHGLGGIDFSKKDRLLLERKDEPWLKNKEAQQLLWMQQLKDSILNQRMNKKTDDEIVKLLMKRHRNILRRLHQSKNEDAFQAYINAFSSIYDPHTQYFSPQTAENFDINMSLSLEGIGAVLTTEDEYTKVVSIVTGGPAETGGQLKQGDKIVSVAQGETGAFEDVVGMRLDDVVKLIRGSKQTLVRLEVIPNNDKSGATKIYEIVRDEVKLEEQDASSQVIEVKQNGVVRRIGVISIPTFYIDFKAAQNGDPNYKSTTRDVRALLTKLKDEKIDGLIIDLRGNGGGSLQEANELTGLFIKSGPTVVVKDSRGKISKQQNPGSTQLYTGPMTVMIDRLSASASEIFAGAMQDYGRAIIVGGQSYGKGTVQSIQPLNHGQLKLTLAKFYRVSGESTQHKGVMPDITFPSLYDGEEIGEDALENAMQWDTIAAVSDQKYINIPMYIAELTKRHKKRIVTDADFIYLKEMRAYMDRYKDIKTVSLNERIRKIEQDKTEQGRLKIENKLRKANGEKPVNTIKELEDLEEAKAEAKKEKKDKNAEPKKDAVLQETGMILSDFITLMNKTPKKG